MENLDKNTTTEHTIKDTEHTNEKFTIEYPLNYNEIVERKLKMLEKEYAETINSNIKQEDLNECPAEDKISSSSSENTLPDIPVDNLDYKKFEYHCLDEAELEAEVEDFIEVPENENENETVENIHIDQELIITNARSDIPEGLEFCQNEKKEIIFVPKSPIKNAERIKVAMRSIHMNPPKWAQNLSDEDFLGMVTKALAEKR